MSRPDVAVVGLGPAGRALAHRLAQRGADVLAVDPHPERRWHPTYGGWRHQLPPWLPGQVVGAGSSCTALVARHRHQLRGEYVVLDNDELQRQLPLDGVQLRRQWLRDEDLPGLAPVVVDCRGNRAGVTTAGSVLQTAHGLRLPRPVGEQLLQDAEAVLMDWRPHDGAAHWGERRPSFLYLVPLPDGRVLAEETCLAGRPPLPDGELAHRLTERLARHRIEPRHWRGADTERVHIPMLPRPAATTVRFGAAGGEVNPITGYSVFASLARADQAAATLLAGGDPTLPPSPWRRHALAALLQLPADGMVDLFEAFGRLPTSSQRAVLEPTSPTPDLLAALTRQWALMPGRGRLVTATARGARANLVGGGHG